MVKVDLLASESPCICVTSFCFQILASWDAIFFFYVAAATAGHLHIWARIKINSVYLSWYIDFVYMIVIVVFYFWIIG